MYIKEEMLELIAIIMIFMNWRERIRRVTRRTRNTRRTRMERKALIPVELSRKISSTKDRFTIMKSKQFIRSLTYSEIPRPRSFKNMSIVNIMVKIWFIWLMIYSSFFFI